MSKKETLCEFYNRWSEKALSCDPNNLSGNFDKFFSQFIIFNRLYVEVAKILVKVYPDIDRQFKCSKRFINAAREQKIITRPILLPDKWCATKGIQRYCHHSQFNEFVFDMCHSELKTITSIIHNRDLYFYEDYVTNLPLWDNDLEMCERIEEKKIIAVLEFIYLIRCNLFHGEKEIIQAQTKLFQAINPVLSVINQYIFDTLMKDDRF
jgi:hypothetical protein